MAQSDFVDCGPWDPLPGTRGGEDCRSGYFSNTVNIGEMKHGYIFFFVKKKVFFFAFGVLGFACFFQFYSPILLLFTIHRARGVPKPPCAIFMPTTVGRPSSKWPWFPSKTGTRGDPNSPPYQYGGAPGARTTGATTAPHPRALRIYRRGMGCTESFISAYRRAVQSRYLAI